MEKRRRGMTGFERIIYAVEIAGSSGHVSKVDGLARQRSLIGEKRMESRKVPNFTSLKPAQTDGVALASTLMVLVRSTACSG